MSGSLIISTELLVRCAHATGVCAAIGQAVTVLGGDPPNMKSFILKPFALSVDKISRAISRDQDIRIVDLWTRSQLLGATDPRDRVFALLSTQTAVSMDIIDYNKDVEAVYEEIAKVVLTMPVPETNWYRTTPCNLKPSPWGTGPQRVSRFLACKTLTKNSWKLPSWVPDWRPSDIRFVPLTRYFPGSAYFSHDYDHATFHGQVSLNIGFSENTWS
ncbi:hypothetical protein BS50DRAFT_659097 [Corynespora cassiicola Philippines]|uniref:Uncharacterized protein n=1 Tax=Corynespora cassiicola Philippines TaxID=1448308 RepID=A0A2T2N194_CORCC|nr:hypothetical protein BS50DRAFT_659097 [Corynespora cassiicola Philippines]